MNNNIKIEQIVYGVGDKGYCVLAKTDGADSYVDEVLQLFESIKVSETFKSTDAIITSKYCYNYTVMACIKNGKTDRYGRGSLFLHAIIVKTLDLRQCFLDAIDFYNNNAFLSSEDNFETINEFLNVSSFTNRKSNQASEIKSLDLPAAILVESPLDGIRFFNENPTYDTRDRSWVSFMHGGSSSLFDIECIDKSITISNLKRNVYNNEFKLIKPLNVSLNNDNKEMDKSKVIKQKKQGNCGWLFFISLLLNVFLVYLVCSKEKSTESFQSNSEAFPVFDQTQYISESEFNKMLNKKIALKNLYDNDRETKVFLDKCKYYIKQTNNNGGK